jgi:hypothetical protein
MTGPTEVSNSACWGRQIISAIPCLDDPSYFGEDSSMPQMRMVWSARMSAASPLGKREEPGKVATQAF